MNLHISITYIYYYYELCPGYHQNKKRQQKSLESQVTTQRSRKTKPSSILKQAIKNRINFLNQELNTSNKLK